MRGGVLSLRTQQLLLDQYNGLSRIENRKPTIIELNKFLEENNITESFAVVMDNIVDLLGRLLSILPSDLTGEQRREVDRLVALMRS